MKGGCGKRPPCEAAELWAVRAYLINQHIRTEVPQRQLQLLEAVVERDLDGDEGVGRDDVGVLSRGRHVCS